MFTTVIFFSTKEKTWYGRERPGSHLFQLRSACRAAHSLQLAFLLAGRQGKKSPTPYKITPQETVWCYGTKWFHILKNADLLLIYGGAIKN